MKELNIEKFYKNSVEVLFVMNKMVAGLQFASEDKNEINNLLTARQGIELVADIFGDNLRKVQEVTGNAK